MTISLMPGIDLVPALPSRVVTIDATTITEGEAGVGSVRFALPCDIHVTTNTPPMIVQAGSVDVPLDANGHGEVRLPCYTADTKPTDWVILVKKSWAPHPYAVRVPIGNGPISLASLDPVRELTAAERSYALTSAAVTIRDGGAWDADASVDGGVLNLALTVPPLDANLQVGTVTTTDGDPDVDLHRVNGVNVLNFTLQRGPEGPAGGTSVTDPQVGGYIASPSVTETQRAGDARWLRASQLLNPDSFPGSTDRDKLQAAVDYSIANDFPAIALGRMYNLTGAPAVSIKKTPWSDRRVLAFTGFGGGIRKDDSGAMFTSPDDNTGDIATTGVTFQSVKGAGAVVWDCDKLIRISSSQCEYRNVDRVAKQVKDGRLFQSMSFRQEHIVGGAGPAFECVESYDVTIDACLIEDRDAVFHNIAPATGRLQNRSLRIINSCMENLAKLPLKLGPCWVAAIARCYFESNQAGVVPSPFTGEAVHIDTYTIQPAAGHMGLVIEGNMLSLTAAQRTARSVAILIGQSYGGPAASSITVRNNILSDGTLYRFGNPAMTKITADGSDACQLGRIAQGDQMWLLPGYYRTSGTTAQRPAEAPIGTAYLDTTLNKMLNLRYRGIAPTATLQIATGATAAGSLTITAGGATGTVAVLAGDSVAAVRDRIVATIQAGGLYPWSAAASGTDTVKLTSTMPGRVTADQALTPAATGVTVATFTMDTLGNPSGWIDAMGVNV